MIRKISFQLYWCIGIDSEQRISLNKAQLLQGQINRALRTGLL